MGYHLILSLPLDLEGIAHDAKTGKRPRHAMLELSQRLGATIHQPGQHQISSADRVLAQITSRPEHWALARNLSKQLTQDDVIFCVGEDIGLPTAVLCSIRPDHPAIAVFVLNLNRPRGKLALKLFDLGSRTNLLLTFTRTQRDFLQNHLNLPDSQLRLIHDQTDTTFFTPLPIAPSKLRPIIASGGMEKRDYRTLAEATQNLAVDVKICAFSRNSKAMERTFPKVIPHNLAYRFYDWLELAQLYRDADIVVISLFENNYSAGFTTLLESLACRKPVIITKSEGPIADLVHSGCVVGVNPGDPDDLRQAIIKLLNHPQEAEAIAQRGYEFVLRYCTIEHYVENLATQLMTLSKTKRLSHTT